MLMGLIEKGVSAETKYNQYEPNNRRFPKLPLNGC